MRNSLLFFAAVSLLLASCQKEQLVEEKLSNGVVTEVSATFEALVPDGATKASVSISENTGTFSWQEDDAAAFVLDSKTAYGKGTYNATSQMFQIQGEANSHHDAVYPYDLVGSTSPSKENVTSVTVPSTREWAANQTNVTMYGTYTSDKYTFKHLGGLVKVTVVNVPTTAKTFVFKTAGKKINGTFTVETDGGEKVIKTNSTTAEGEDIYTLNLPTTITANSTMDFYVPLPVGDGYKFAFYLKDDSSNDLVKIEGTTAQTVTRKSILVMPTITLAAASIEDIYKSATVQEVPAGHSGDFLLAKSEKVVLKVNTSTVDKNITLKYNGVNLPTNLKIEVVGDGHFDAKLSGDLPYTHVDFTEGGIKEVDITTSGSTFNIIHPAKISDKLTVGGGNVVIEGAKVGAIEVVAGAKANPTTGEGTVKITMNTATVESQEIKPEVVGTIVANADIEVAPAQGVEVFVAPAEKVQVNTGGNAEVIVVKVDHKPVMIGTTGYDDLADAIDHVNEGQTIKVLNDISKAKGISVPSGKNFTVDFGGHKYAVEKPGAGSTNTQTQAFQLLQESTIVFKNGTIECTAANKDYTWGSNAEIKGIAMIIQNYANLTLENMTIDATNVAHNGNPGTPRYAVSNNCGTVEFKGNTTIKAPVAGDFAFDVCKFGSYSEPKVTWNSTGSVTGKIELTGGEFVVAKDLALTQPIRTKDAAAKLTVNANITPASGWNAGDALVIVNRTGNLTISGNGKISNNSNANVYAAVKMTESGEAADASEVAKKAKLTVDGTVTLEGDYYGITGNGSRHGTEITVNGGTIRGTHTNDNLGIYHPQEGTLTISGGTIEGYSSAVEVRSGNVNISGNCSLKSTATTFSCKSNGSGNTTVGAALAIAQHTTRKAINVTIDGGTFTGYKAISVEDPETGDPQNVNVVIKGGTFSDLYGIVYAAYGAIYKLGNNVAKANGISVPSGKNFTVDFGGHKYAVEKPGAGSTNTKTQAFQLLQESTIVFKNGTIECTAANKDYTWGSNAEIKGIAMIIQNYANLTLENMTIDATNVAHNGNPGTPRYAVSNNCGTVEFKGNTTIKAPVAGDFAFDVCKFGSYSEPKVTWNSTGSVTGKIELTGGEFVVAKDLALTQPIRTKDAAAKLTVNANITPASGWNAGDALVIVNRTGNLTISGNGKISNNSNANVYAAVKMTESGEAADASEVAKKAKLTVDGTVTLEGDYYGITGNGSRHGTEITVNGGTIRGTHTNDNLGIYHPQEGTLTITNGTIEGYSSAVEMRAGTLNITGGSFTSTASPYDFTQNGSGNTIKGVAIAISEHSTKKGITAKLDGGTFTGGAYQLGVAGLNDRINITKASNLEITVNSGYKWNDVNKLVVDAKN